MEARWCVKLQMRIVAATKPTVRLNLVAVSSCFAPYKLIKCLFIYRASVGSSMVSSILCALMFSTQGTFYCVQTASDFMPLLLTLNAKVLTVHFTHALESDILFQSTNNLGDFAFSANQISFFDQTLYQSVILFYQAFCHRHYPRERLRFKFFFFII